MKKMYFILIYSLFFCNFYVKPNNDKSVKEDIALIFANNPDKKDNIVQLIETFIVVLEQLVKDLKFDFKLEDINKQKSFEELDYRVYNATGIFGSMVSVSTPEEGGPYGVSNIYFGDSVNYHQGTHKFPAIFRIETKKGIWDLLILNTIGKVEILIKKSDLNAKDAFILSGCEIKELIQIF